MNKKLIATDEAVGVSVPKSKLINEGPETFNEAWEIARTQKIASTPGYNELEIRDIVFSDTGESLEMKFLLAKIQESET